LADGTPEPEALEVGGSDLILFVLALPIITAGILCWRRLRLQAKSNPGAREAKRGATRLADLDSPKGGRAQIRILPGAVRLQEEDVPDMDKKPSDMDECAEAMIEMAEEEPQKAKPSSSEDDKA